MSRLEDENNLESRELAWAGELPYLQQKRNSMILVEIADLDRWLDGHKVAC